MDAAATAAKLSASDRAVLLALAATDCGQMNHAEWSKTGRADARKRLEEKGFVAISGLTFSPKLDYVVYFTDLGAAILSSIL